jgi:hypothetical protein
MLPGWSVERISQSLATALFTLFCAHFNCYDAALRPTQSGMFIKIKRRINR